jgi:hypothetical protein
LIILNAAAKEGLMEKSYNGREFAFEVDKHRNSILDFLNEFYGKKVFSLEHAARNIKKIRPWTLVHAKAMVKVALLDGVRIRCVKLNPDDSYQMIDLRELNAREIDRPYIGELPLRVYWRRDFVGETTLWCEAEGRVKTTKVGLEELKIFRNICHTLDIPFVETLRYEAEKAEAMKLEPFDPDRLQPYSYDKRSKKNIEPYIKELRADGSFKEAVAAAIITDDEEIIYPDAPPV